MTLATILPLADAPSEADLIVARVARRLDRLETPDAGPESIAQITDADARHQALGDAAALDALLALFGGTEADRAILLTCLAPEFDPRLLPRYHALTGRAWATDWLASILFARPGQVILTEGSTLLRWRLIRLREDQPGAPAAILPDPGLRNWLSGLFEIPQALETHLRCLDAPEPLSDWPVAQTAESVAQAFGRGLNVLIGVRGLTGAGRASFIAAVAQRLDLACLCADPTRPGWTSEAAILSQRLALVTGAALVWRDWPDAVAPDARAPALQAVTLAPGAALPDTDGLAPITVDLAPMRAPERAAMIAARIPESAQWSPETRARLAERAALTPAAIAHIARIAPRTDAEALAATNQSQASVMGALAQRMSAELGWDDLILPAPLAADLRDLAFEASARDRVFTRGVEMARLFARERGLVALFHGAPGTGKTMAAQVLAREMGVDLFRIDCASVISKYIGETARNLTEIFARAREIDAVLLFDEADALFSRRTEIRDSNDRHSNADTAQLLQLIEGQFGGVALLASNRKSDIDAAFLRRIRYSFEFPRPDAEARSQLWARAAEALDRERAEALAPLWPVLGAALDITGAQIKTVLLSSWFAAGRQGRALDATLILHLAERELAKEGRALGLRDRERIRSHG